MTKRMKVLGNRTYLTYWRQQYHWHLVNGRLRFTPGMLEDCAATHEH